MIIENLEYCRTLVNSAHPDLGVLSMDENQLQEVLQKDGEHIRRLRTYGQAQSSKHAWKAKRSNFMQGIRRFHRNSSDLADVQKRVANRLKRYKDRIAFSGTDDATNQYQDEAAIKIDIPETELNEFLHDLILIEAGVARTSALFALEEIYVDSTLFLLEVIDSLGVMKKALLSEAGPASIPFDVFETFLVLVGPELFEDYSQNSDPLCPQFSKLLLTEPDPTGVDIR